jgi:apolipoprotein N-acyltransferase
MNKYFLTALSIAGGLLSGLAWTGWCSGLILLTAFVPFLIIENYLAENPKRYTPNAFFIFILPGLVLFSIMVMGWMRVASLTGAICVIMGLSFLMAFMMWLAHVVRLRAGIIAGIISLVAFWLSYEYLSLNINIVSPWMNLGNGLAKDILFIQWYEYTGTSGGSLWILCSNIFLTAFLINSFSGRRKKIPYLLVWLAIVIIPSAISVRRYFTIKQTTDKGTEVVIIQPNTDPYTEKFNIPFENQLQSVLNQAMNEITDKTRFVITPETTIDDPANLDDLKNDKYILMIKSLLRNYPGVDFISGLVTYKLYPSSTDAPTNSARRIDASGLYYDHFNSAVRIDTGNVFSYYHKSKLVPGIEMQFSNGPGRLIAKILPGLGGTKWGYGIQKDRTCLTHRSINLNIAPVICYESVFGNFVAGYIKKGAEAIFIITNDGWWKNTSGYRQHLDYASLRAIETRRMVARSANTGVSCIIDIKGRRLSETGWWQKATLKGEIFPESRLTFYVKHGDYILKTSVLCSLVILVICLIPFKKKLTVKSI